MRSATSSIVLVLVTALLVPYGSHSWSWVAGPIAALAVWGLDQVARRPAAPAPAHRPTAVHSEPEPVD